MSTASIGLHSAALAAFGLLIVSCPAIAAGQQAGDPAALRVEARELASRGQYAEALRTIDRALALAPDDLDIRMARARILLWSGRTAEARDEADRIAARRPDYPEFAELRDAIDTAGERRAALFVSASLADVSLRSGNQQWTTVSFGGYRQLNELTTLAGSVEREHRAIGTDVRLSSRLDRRFGGATAYLSLAGTPDADFREKWSVGAGAEVPIGRVTAILDYRHARYAQSSVDIFNPALRVPLGSDRVSATVKGIAVLQAGNAAQFGISGRIDASLPSGITLSGGLATYPDTEAGVTRQVRGGFAGLGVPLTERLTLRVTADYERREATYTRKGLAVGLSWRLGR